MLALENTGTFKVYDTTASLLSTNASVRDETKFGEPGLNTVLFATLGEMSAEFWDWKPHLRRRMEKGFLKVLRGKNDDTVASEELASEESGAAAFLFFHKRI